MASERKNPQLKEKVANLEKRLQDLEKKFTLVGNILTALILVVFIYGYPRLIVNWLGESNPWTSYLYMYGFGLVVFLVGIRLILKTGACQLKRGRDGFWFGILIGGFVFFATLHAVWILVALNIPHLGAP